MIASAPGRAAGASMAAACTSVRAMPRPRSLLQTRSPKTNSTEPLRSTQTAAIAKRAWQPVVELGRVALVRTRPQNLSTRPFPQTLSTRPKTRCAQSCKLMPLTRPSAAQGNKHQHLRSTPNSRLLP
eukprot:365455-Chlamydomonas_euryale.AAC.11